MQIKKSIIPSGVILSYGSDVIGLTEDDQRDVLAWFKTNKPELLREVHCDDCPRIVWDHNYFQNKREE